jgi:hypothetical protein
MVQNIKNFITTMLYGLRDLAFIFLLFALIVLAVWLFIEFGKITVPILFLLFVYQTGKDAKAWKKRMK